MIDGVFYCKLSSTPGDKEVSPSNRHQATAGTAAS